MKKKRMFDAFIICVLLSNIIFVRDVFAINDNFESYSNGQYPSSGGWYNLFSGKTAAVSTAYAYSGSKSFRLEGYSNWSRIDVINVNTTNEMSYEVAVFIPDAARGASVGFFEKQGNQGPSYNAIVFRNDGTIYTGGTNESNRFIQSYNSNTWYRIKVTLDFTQNKMDVYVNGSLKRSGISAKGESYCKKFGLATSNFSGSGTAITYFDDVKVLDITPPPPDIDVNPDSHNFGNVVINDSTSFSFEVLNLDVGLLVVAEVLLIGTDAEQFTILSGGGFFTLEAFQSHNIVVMFQPDSPGTKSAKLRLTSNDPDKHFFDVNLSGTGVNPPESVSKPNKPSGAPNGKVGQSLDFSTGGSSSNLGHSVEYQFDWGDGTTSSWDSANRSHSYSSSGTFDVKARARCSSHTSKVSSWSSSTSVSISYCQLSISVTPSGSGTVNKNPDKTNFTWNENVQLTANANSGYEFDYWSGDLSGSANTKSLTMNGDKNVTAHFKQIQEAVSVPNLPSGASSGKVGQSLSLSVGGSSSNLGHSIKYQFDWGDGTTSNWDPANLSHSYSSSGTFDVKARACCTRHTSVVSSWSSSKSVVISFCQLSVSVTPSGSGSVSKNPDKNNFNWNESVQLTANANAGYEFDYWSGALTGSTNPQNLTMDDDKSVTAFFKVVIQNSAPSKPILVSVNNNSFTMDSKPDLMWNVPSDPDSDPLHFKVEIAMDNSFTSQIAGSPFESQNNSASFSPTPPMVQGSGTCSFTPPQPLEDGDYWWRVTAWDGKAHSAPSAAWKFTVDAAKPYTAGHNPAKDATNIAVNTNIVVHIKDDLSGADISTIVLKVNLVQVSPTITGDSKDVTLTYSPQAGFDNDSRVTVIVSAKDIAGNEMETDYYSFNTEKKAQKPAFLTMAVKEHGLSEPFNVDINVEEVNELFGVSFVFNYPENHLEYLSFEPGDFMGGDVVPFTSPPSNGHLPVAITKKAGQVGSNGSGLIVQIKLKERPGVTTGTNIELSCTELVANDPAGKTILLTPNDTSYVTPFPTSIEMKDTQIPKDYVLFQNYPNPFNPTTIIAFALPKPSQVRLQIFNLKGNLVKTLINAQQEQGMHSVQWNGTDEKRNKVASGIYIYKLTAGDEVLHRRLVLMK